MQGGKSHPMCQGGIVEVGSEEDRSKTSEVAPDGKVRLGRWQAAANRLAKKKKKKKKKATPISLSPGSGSHAAASRDARWR